MKQTLVAVVILLVLAAVLPAVAAACPNCTSATSTTEKPGQTGVWRGMYWSILLMVGAPFAMVSAMIVAVRRARRKLDAAQPPAVPPLPFPGGGSGARL
jgi:hypothetical protein